MCLQNRVCGYRFSSSMTSGGTEIFSLSKLPQQGDCLIYIGSLTPPRAAGLALVFQFNMVPTAGVISFARSSYEKLFENLKPVDLQAYPVCCSKSHCIQLLRYVLWEEKGQRALHEPRYDEEPNDTGDTSWSVFFSLSENTLLSPPIPRTRRLRRAESCPMIMAKNCDTRLNVRKRWNVWWAFARNANSCLERIIAIWFGTEP